MASDACGFVVGLLYGPDQDDVGNVFEPQQLLEAFGVCYDSVGRADVPLNDAGIDSGNLRVTMRTGATRFGRRIHARIATGSIAQSSSMRSATRCAGSRS